MRWATAETAGNDAEQSAAIRCGVSDDEQGRLRKPVETLSQVIIRFAGDSGDGMQLTGDRFTVETAAFGNSLSTLPDFPAEIRAPAGTLPGVSAFQLHFADHTRGHPGRCTDGAGRDEPGGAEGEPA